MHSTPRPHSPTEPNDPNFWSTRIATEFSKVASVQAKTTLNKNLSEFNHDLANITTAGTLIFSRGALVNYLDH